MTLFPYKQSNTTFGKAPRFAVLKLRRGLALAAALCTVVLLSTACGQRGPLSLPQPPAPMPPPSATTTATTTSGTTAAPK